MLSISLFKGLSNKRYVVTPHNSYTLQSILQSHHLRVLTFPPEAQREPSGDTVTQFRYPW